MPPSLLRTAGLQPRLEMSSLRIVDAKAVIASAGRLPATPGLDPVPAVSSPAHLERGRLRLVVSAVAALFSRAAGRAGRAYAALHLASIAQAANSHRTAAHVAAGKALVRLGRENDALQAFRRAAEVDGSDRDGNWQRARLLVRLERTTASPEAAARLREELLVALREAAQSSSDAIRAEASVQLSNLLHELGDCPAALMAANVAASLSHAPRAVRAKTYALVAAGQVENAELELAKLREREPDDPGSRSLSAILQTLRTTDNEAAVPAESGRILVGVGGGIGDMLHVTPAIRNLARRTGQRVDVLVAADHPGAEFLLGHTEYVHRVRRVSPAALDRHYDRVWLTHSFGKLRLPFKAEQVLISRAWCAFKPGHLNETVFNLEAAKALLDVPYGEDDATRYFAGELVWTRPAMPLVGLHAGSKGGRWLSKRWPHFAELAARLKASGIAVASFGTSDEYVEGSEDSTGGSIEDMSRSMLDCSAFVSNDSGPMHIASATGMPVLALYAPTDPFTHLPLAPNVTALALEKPCAPCEVKNHAFFASGDCRCVSEVSLDAVEQKALELVGEVVRTMQPAAGGAP